MKPARAALLVAGIYAASLLSSFALLVAGAIAAGNSGASRAETVLLAVLAASAFLFALGSGAVYWILGRAGLRAGARILSLLGYGTLAGATLLVLFLVGALAFNR